MASPSDTHPVLVAHLEQLATVLDASYGLSLSGDLERRYRNLDQTVRPSTLTRALEDQRDRFESYLEDARPKPAEPERVDE